MTVRKIFEVTVVEVYSGDDLILMVDLGFGGLFKKVRARLCGVDAPSAFKARRGTEAGEVRQLLRDTVARGKCSIELQREGPGGWLVTLFVAHHDGASLNVNEMMTGLGYVYTPQHSGSK